MLPLHMIFRDHSLFTYENMEICVFLILLCVLYNTYTAMLFTYENMEICVFLILLCEILNPYFENIMMNVFDYHLLYLFLLYLLNVY